MILGVGIDIVDLAGFRAQLEDPASVFVDRTFTAAELRDAQTRPSADPPRHLAVRHAAKEAFIKAWSAARWGQAPQLSSVNPHEIEVICDAYGRPALRLSGAVAAAVTILGALRLHLSLSHDGGQATAMVVLEGHPETSNRSPA